MIISQLTLLKLSTYIDKFSPRDLSKAFSSSPTAQTSLLINQQLAVITLDDDE